MDEKEQLDILKEWLKLHKGLLFKVVRSFTMTDLDDLFQEILIQVWHSIPGFRKQSSVSTWLYRIALNTAIKWSKKEKKYTGTRSLSPITELLQENKTPADDRLNWLYAEIHKLDEIDRSLILLLLEGFSYKEISSMLGITESNVGVKINRIKNQLIVKSKKYENNGI